MFYVRFLKRPSRTSEHGRTTILALITLTTDLGDDFCDEDTLLQASLYSDDSGPTSPFYSETLTWKARSRSRPVQIVCQRRPTASRIGLHVGPAQGPEAPHAVVHGAGLILPQRVIAGQTIVYQAGDGAGTASARYVERRLPLSDGYCLRVSEDSGESIARHIWDAGVGLVAFLDRVKAGDIAAEQLPPQISRALRARGRLAAIELGCGCGVVGLAFAHLAPAADVVLTDLPDAAELATHNINRFSASAGTAPAPRVRFAPLDWHHPVLPAQAGSGTPDIVLLADCIYNPDSSPALVTTLQLCVAASPAAAVIIATKTRHRDEAVFFELMLAAGFSVRARSSVQLSHGGHVEIFIYSLAAAPHR